MHYSDLLIPACIILWAGFEYHRREQNHKEKMAFLERGLIPPESSPVPPRWQLWTTGFTTLCLFAFVCGMVLLGLQTEPRYAVGFFFIALPFFLISIVLFLIFRRDYRMVRGLSNRKGNESCL